MKVTKRNGTITTFDSEKIETAILKAMKYGSGVIKPAIAKAISEEIRIELRDKKTIEIEDIETLVFDKLITKKQRITAKSYEGFRKIREYQRERSLVDNTILGIVNGTDKEIINENSNKDAFVVATQRDLIAGEVSKDLFKRTIMPEKLAYADEIGIIHYHDKDYAIQPIFNCDLVNLKDMLTNGTVINKKLIEPPKSFQTACTVMTQIAQQVASGQYGGQTMSIAHLAPFVRISYEKIKKAVKKELAAINFDLTPEEEEVEIISKMRLKEEIKAGVQTIQFQINTFNTSNGQAPFLTLFMYLNEELEYVDETAMIIREILNQRYLGMKNEVGVPVTASFPKLIYVLDENNIYPMSKYHDITQLAAKCVARRMMPDFISAKVMKLTYNGNVFPCMGCRSFLSEWKDEDGNNKWYGRFNQGVVTINLPDVGLSANKDMKEFWKIFDERLLLCKEALILRHELLEDTISDVSPIHWQNGAVARLKKGENINKYLHGGYSTISLGYIGLYECVLALIGESHTTEKGKELALQIMNHMKMRCNEWKAEEGIGFALYGTPAESTTYTFSKKLKTRFGIIPGITDKDYLTNSYHINVKEEIDPFTKLEFESIFQTISSGGYVSYVEASNLTENLDAVMQLIQYMYETILYAEINTKSDYCHECGFDGEILLDENYEWYCPNCGNRNHSTMNVCRRVCGYLGDNFFNLGRTQDIGNRVIHLDNHDLEEV